MQDSQKVSIIITAYNYCMYYSSQDHDTLREDHQIPSTSTSGMTSATLIMTVNSLIFTLRFQVLKTLIDHEQLLTSSLILIMAYATPLYTLTNADLKTMWLHLHACISLIINVCFLHRTTR